MVLEKNLEFWVCPYCGGKYEDEDDAIECARQCVDIKTPEELDETKYFCEMCEKEHKNYMDAEACENRHIKKADKYFEEYQRREEMKKLAKAAAHPAQTKLNEVSIQ